MVGGRPKAALVVTAAEREALEQWAQRPKTAQALAQRARIVLACATGAPNTTVAKSHRGDDADRGGSGGRASSGDGSTACWMSRGRVRPAASPTRRSRRW